MTDTIPTLTPRMKNPAVLLPGAVRAVQALAASSRKGDVPAATLELVHLRVSQIKGRSFCVSSGWGSGEKTDAAGQELFAVAAWQDAPYFTEAERAALALAKAVTRLSDRPDPVPDEIWDESTRHYDGSDTVPDRFHRRHRSVRSSRAHRRP